MDAYMVERLVPGEPPAVRSAISALVHAIWASRVRTVTVGDGLRVDAIATDTGTSTDDVDVWLSWELDAEHDSTHVRLLLDELDSGPDPTEALGELLDKVAATVQQRRIPG